MRFIQGFCLVSIFLLSICSCVFAQEDEEKNASAAAILEQILDQDGIEAVKSRFAELNRDNYPFDLQDLFSLYARLRQSDRPAEALEILLLIEKVFPNSGGVQINLAGLYDEMGNAPLAGEHCRKFLDIRDEAVKKEYLSKNADALLTTAGQVIDRYIEAAGGLERLRSLRTMQIVYVGHDPRGKGEKQVIQLKAPHFVRKNMGNSGVFLVTDGSHTWKDAEGEWSSLDMDARICGTDIYGDFVDYQEKGISYEYAGFEIHRECPMYHLTKIFQDGYRRELYFSADTGLLSMWTERGVTGIAQVEFWDYREVDGLLVPFISISTSSGVDATHGLTVESVEINIPLDDALFVKSQ